MEQVIIGGTYNLLDSSTTEYNVVMGRFETWSNLELFGTQCIPTPGKLKNLRVEINDTPGGGTKTYKFTLRRAVGIGAWGNTALTCTVASGVTQANDMVNEVSVAAGDVVILECDPTDAPTARMAKWSMVFEGDNARESILLFRGQANLSGNRYFAVTGGYDASSEVGVRSICPTGGTIKNLYVWLSEDPGDSDDAYSFTLRIGGASQTLTCTIVVPDRTGNDEAHPISVSAGNIFSFLVEDISAPSVSPYAACGMTFVADTDGESLLLGGSADPLQTTSTRYSQLIPQGSYRINEYEAYQLAQICTLKKLYVALDGTPGGTDKYVFTVRRNDASPGGGLVVEIIGAATTGNDTANTITIANDDELTLMVVPVDTPTSRKAHWGLVSFIGPPTAPSGGGSPLAQMIQAGLV